MANGSTCTLLGPIAMFNTLSIATVASGASLATPLLRLDFGSLTIKERIYHLQNLDAGSLASEIYRAQVKFKFPGLVNECRELIRIYGNVFTA